jgi:hypothetical protein
MCQNGTMRLVETVLKGAVGREKRYKGGKWRR